jgi:high-affinity iron transporter
VLQALIITLREGVEAALIVGITLAYLTKIGRADLRRAVYWGLGSAVVASGVGAVLLSRLKLNQDIVEGWIMLVAACFVVTMIVFMMRTARRLKGEIEQRVGALAGRGSLLGLFGFIFLMVLREGIETVLVLSAVSLNSTELLSFAGTLIGLALAVIFGVTFVQGSVRINLQKFFRVTTVILFFVAAQLLVTGLHELAENGAIPSSKQEMALIGPIVRNDVFFFVTILALVALMVLLEYRRRAEQPAKQVDSRAALRKQQWSARRDRLWMTSVYASSFLFIVLITAEFIYAKSTSNGPPATAIVFQGGRANLPISDIADGDLHLYATTVNDKPVRFFLYRKPDGKVAALLDACEICGGAGFYKKGNGLVCRNCAAPINPNSVGTPGGCNPVPLESSSDGTTVTLLESTLAGAAHHFEK